MDATTQTTTRVNVMDGTTDLEKARMQIKWLKRDIRQICSKAWFTSPRLKEAQNNVPNYFIEEHGLTEKAITEAYFLGRQDGRLTMAQAIMKRLGLEEEEMDIVDQLRDPLNWYRSADMDLVNNAADEIDRLRKQQKLIIGIFRINMMRWAEGYSDEDFDTKIAHILGEKE